MRSYKAGTYDIYDDGGVLLKQLVPEQGELPDFVKEASPVGHDEHQNLYALVMIEDGKVLQKFATADPGNTWLSTLYFARTKSNLPIEAQKVAAANLIEACDAFEIEIPDFLYEVADGPPDTNLVDVTGLTPPSILKTASVVADAAARNDEVQYAIERADGTKYFPIGDAESVSTAMDYFEREHRNFVPRERREFAVKVAHLAAKGQLPMPDSLRKYAGEGINPDFEDCLLVRLTHLQHDDGSLEAEIVKLGADARTHSCDDIAAALTEFDMRAGLSALWDRDIPDPYLSTFGLYKAAKGKTEDLGETFTLGPDSVTADDLGILASRGKAAVSNHFGAAIAQGFEADPVAVFKSMPSTQKRVMMRMANSHESIQA